MKEFDKSDVIQIATIKQNYLKLNKKTVAVQSIIIASVLVIVWFM